MENNQTVKSKNKWTPKMLAFAALCLALSFVLSYIRLFKLPQGGSITPASMLPLMAFSYVFGIGPGLIVSVAYGMLQFLQNPSFASPIQMLLDYPLAFGAMALCAVSRYLPMKRHGLWSWIIGTLFSSTGRFLCHVISGAVFFAEYAAGSGQTPVIYSIIYNCFVFVDAAVCIAVIAVPQVRKIFEKLDT